ncbi:hypothetical protein [Pseudotamlana carrageenivorans]|uniref:Serine acetyltransferase n=1 Tax=Pseudotamlana carrageenivorans TaxID=2069432 RepID=A0A2I7SIV2_9FLAO|nr:hypothetical protein [Tamlana carrageenivorans]AUS05836.1 hypothetical protein C1A40_10350 [Tamlana carrageenivorans]
MIIFKDRYFPHYFKIIRQTYIKQRVDTFITYFKAYYWGVQLEKGSEFVGLPKFRKTPKSSIYIGKNARLLSSFSANLHGLNRKCMISTLDKNASITIGDNFGMSGGIIASALKVTIGSRVMIGANCTITDTDSHALNFKDRHANYYNLKTKDYKEPIKK